MKILLPTLILVFMSAASEAAGVGAPSFAAPQMTLGSVGAAATAFLPLAQVTPPPGTEEWLKVVFYLIASATTVLGFIKLWRDQFGRRPPLDDSLEALTKQLAGLAPNEKVEALVTELKKSASKEDLAKVMSVLMDKERDLQAQIKDVRAYAHNGIHDLRGDVDARLLDGRETHDKQADEMWKVVNGVRLAVSRIESDVSAVKALRESNGERLGELSKKTDDLGTKVDRLGGIIEAKLKVGGKQ